MGLGCRVLDERACRRVQYRGHAEMRLERNTALRLRIGVSPSFNYRSTTRASPDLTLLGQKRNENDTDDAQKTSQNDEGSSATHSANYRLLHGRAASRTVRGKASHSVVPPLAA